MDISFFTPMTFRRILSTLCDPFPDKIIEALEHEKRKAERKR